MKRHVIEDESLTLSKFIQGLRDELRRELFFRGVTTLDHAYSLTLDYKLLISATYEKRSHHCSLVSSASPRHKSIIEPSSFHVPHISTPPPPIKSLLEPFLSNVSPVLENKGEISEIPRASSHLQYFNYKDFGHIYSERPS